MTRGGLWALTAALVLGPLGCGADPLDHWTRRASGIGTETAAVLYAGNQFLAVGAQGWTLNSNDGVSWLSQYGAGIQHLSLWDCLRPKPLCRCRR